MPSTHSMLFVVLAASSVVACKRSPAPFTDGEACNRIGALPGTKWTPADVDSCYLTYSSIGPNVRSCTDGCIRRSATAADFDDCRDDCTGAVYPSYMVCQKISMNDHHVDECRERHDALLAEAKDRYKCWSRCGRRAATALDAEACDRTCGVPEN